jgi:hypothetical protein
MYGSKVAILLCVSFALTMAAPISLLDILNPVDDLLNNVVGNLVVDLNNLLKDVTGLVAQLLKVLIAIINAIIKTLNVPSGQDVLDFVKNLISQLEPPIQQLLGAVSSGAGEIIDDVSP